ncbi:MAG: hypothetical protein ACP5D7_12670 [Limnospira sp.]
MSLKTIILSSCAIAAVLAINTAGVMAAEPSSPNFDHPSPTISQLESQLSDAIARTAESDSERVQTARPPRG